MEEQSEFKKNMHKFNRINGQLKKLGLYSETGVVIDPKMPSFQIICRYDALTDDETNFLDSNPVIAQHLVDRQSKIDAYNAEQAKAHAWANRRDDTMEATEKVNKGELNKLFLSSLDEKSKGDILQPIAKHYGTNVEHIEAEVTDEDAEHLLEYMTEPERSMAFVVMNLQGFGFDRYEAKTVDSVC